MMTTPAANYSQLLTLLQQLVNEVQSLIQQVRNESAGSGWTARFNNGGSDAFPVQSGGGYVDMVLIGAGGGGGGGYDAGGGTNGAAGRGAPVIPTGGPTLTSAGEAQAA